MKVEEYVLQNYTKLNETDLQIWNFIKDNKQKMTNLTINELASYTNVSRTTISRFVKKVGFSGYSEFKIRFHLEKEEPINQMDNRVFDYACNLIIQYIEEQQHKNYNRICEMIDRANKIFVYGSGDIQNAVAKQLKRMFVSCQTLIYDIGGVTFDQSMLEVIQHGDLVILISLSGNNAQIIELARQLKVKGIHIISITEFKNNVLTDLSDESLYISSTSLNVSKQYPDYKITMLYFILVELLFIKYSIYKNNHFGEQQE